MIADQENEGHMDITFCLTAGVHLRNLRQIGMIGIIWGDWRGHHPRGQEIGKSKHKIPPPYSRAEDCARSFNGCRDDGLSGRDRTTSPGSGKASLTTDQHWRHWYGKTLPRI